MQELRDVRRHQNYIMRFVFIALLLLAQPIWAEPAAPAVRLEITFLLDRLQSSGCQFNRNGTWHTAPEARAHLFSKLEYLEKRASVQSTEQFIDLAASRSTVSGKPYQVTCGNTAPVDSKLWLTTELQALRSGAKTKAPVSQASAAQKSK